MAKQTESQVDAAIAEREAAGGVQPPQPEDAQVVGPMQGISAESLYGKPGEGVNGEEGLSDATVKPTDEKAEEEKPPEKSEEKPPVEKDEEADTKPGWDKERQKKDQQLANLRKTNEVLLSQLKASGDKPDGEDTVATIDKPLMSDEDFNEFLGMDAPDEFADEDERKAYDGKRNLAMRELLRRDQVRTQNDAARTEEEVMTANRSAYNTLLDEADAQYGAEHRNAAVKQMADLWQEQGFTPGNYPSAEITRLAIMGVYAQLALKASGKPPVKKATKKSIPLDSGRGGDTPTRKKGGDLNRSNEQALAEMVESGEADWLKGQGSDFGI